MLGDRPVRLREKLTPLAPEPSDVPPVVGAVLLGAMALPAQEAAALLRAQGIEAAAVNARFIKPMDEANSRIHPPAIAADFLDIHGGSSCGDLFTNHGGATAKCGPASR